MVPENFQFSQGSLQDFADCPRRFQLRYIRKLAWPAIEVEPVEEQEKRMQLGVDFHSMVQGHLSGIPSAVLEQNVMDENLSRWWHSYLVYRPYEHPGIPYPELTLTLPVAGHRLIAKYDLLVVEAGHQVTILDWKTTQFLPRKVQLDQRMQTKVYRYVCACAGQYLYAGASIHPDQIQMIYWFPEYPESPVMLPYSRIQFESDAQALTQVINEIKTLTAGDFRMTSDTKRCSFCRYRTYCGTGVTAGRVESYVDEVEDSTDSDDIDFEHITEIEF